MKAIQGKPRDVFVMLQLNGLERITHALRHGEAFDDRDLMPLAHRCRALADAYDWRKSQEAGE